MNSSNSTASRRMPTRRGGLTTRSTIVGVLLVAAAGLTIGYLLPQSDTPEVGVDSDSVTAGQASPAEPSAEPVPAHRFALSAADVKDSIEAPSIAVDSTGRIFLAWVTESAPDRREVTLTSSADGGKTFATPWTVVTTGIHTSVSQMRARRIERRLKTLPQIATYEDTLYLMWVEAGEARESVILRLAQSVDGGRTFSDPVAVHRSRDARPTFTSLHVADDGTVVCSWLDNRHRVQQPFAAVRRPGASQFEAEQMVYSGPDNAGICPCCPTAAFVSGEDVLVAFRANESGYRDIHVARRTAAEPFSEPQSVVGPTWQFDGCPHDGPSLCETSRGLHVAWMDAHEGLERVYLSTLRNHGDQSGVLTPGSAGSTTQGHARVVSAGDRIHLAWDQSLPVATAQQTAARIEEKAASPVESPPSGLGRHQHGPGHPEESGGRAVYYATSSDGGQSLSRAIAVARTPGHFQTRPQIVVLEAGHVVVAWMELSANGKDVVVTSVPVPADETQRLLTQGGEPHE